MDVAMDFKQFGEKIVDLTTGVMFGELALMKSAARNATIIAHENCQLLTLRKSQFDMIKNLYSSEMIFKKEFILQLLPTLTEINSDRYVNEILENLSNVGHLKGYTLTRQGSAGDEIFLLKSGTCKISLALDSGEYMEICEVGPGSIIGEEIIFDSDTLYTFTTLVSSKEAQFLTLRKKFCTKSLPYSSLSYLKLNYESKLSSRLAFISHLCHKTSIPEILTSTNPPLYTNSNNTMLGIRIRRNAAPKPPSDLFSKITLDKKLMKQGVRN